MRVNIWLHLSVCVCVCLCLWGWIVGLEKQAAESVKDDGCIWNRNNVNWTKLELMSNRLGISL